jgi:hypothetical protein
MRRGKKEQQARQFIAGEKDRGEVKGTLFRGGGLGGENTGHHFERSQDSTARPSEKQQYITEHVRIAKGRGFKDGIFNS